jgi:hypothetical protein
MANALARRTVVAGTIEEITMHHHHETVAIAEQRRAELLADAASSRAVRAARNRRYPVVRWWQTRARDI